MIESLVVKKERTAAEKERLLANLEKYRKMALDRGVEDPRIVPASDIVQSIRTRMTCSFGHCNTLGSSYFCPPKWETPYEYAKAMLASYDYTIMYRMPFKDENFHAFTGPNSSKILDPLIHQFRKYWSPDDVKYWQGVLEERPGVFPPSRKGGSIALAIERAAREDGYHFAFTGHAGSCSTHLCDTFGGTCPALTTGLCRFTGESRPDGASAMYVDYFRTNGRLGWQNWVAGWSLLPEDFPSGPLTPSLTLTGLVFID